MANPLRKTMVYLGLADEEYDEPQDAREERPRATQLAAAPAPKAADRAPVTPLRRPAPVRVTAPGDMNEILTVHPRHYKDAQSIAESFREGIPVIINLSQMSEPDARRLIDFASGLSQGLYGKIERVTSKVFLLSPQHVAVSGDQAEPDSDVDAQFFAQ
ncbi:cell division protein SepF [Homoserinibacter sp. YIM 151385]|uniref:cell division protein SepF n=1 Tax=Homoserinibacter sp. YIM 151385 TaxID=2985506 RepID=UPI0022F0E9E9|nr:cell division protein SepF [Homoserinibacter sp. YIM 151385]WBU38734.1 cell division protein SepF [Homoserinibacter sp. YIM 151385]